MVFSGSAFGCTKCSSTTLSHRELEELKKADIGGIYCFEYKTKMVQETIRQFEETIGEVPHREKPVRLWIGGCDDSSYAKNFTDTKEPLDLITKWDKLPPTFEELKDLKFIFTN